MKYGGIYTCACGTRFRSRKYPCGAEHKDRCRPCNNAVNNAHALTKVEHPCDMCGEPTEKTRQSINQQRSDEKRGVRSFRLLCTSCNEEWRESTRVWKVNPMGANYCRAPVPGNCPRLRKPNDSTRKCVLCYGHDKRRQRGGDLTTHIRVYGAKR